MGGGGLGRDGSMTSSSGALSSSAGGSIGRAGGLRGDAMAAVPAGENASFFLLAREYGRGGWRAGIGSSAFDSRLGGWKVPGWEEEDGGEVEAPVGFTFRRQEQQAGVGERDQGNKRRRM